VKPYPTQRTRAAALSLLALLALTPAAATDYFVAPDGDDGAAGTSPQAAWATLARAQRVRLRPGDRLLFRRGGVWQGGLRLERIAGSPAAPVVVGAYGQGPAPLFDGTYSPRWTRVGPGLYRTAMAEGGEPGLLHYRGQPRPRLTVLRFPDPPAGLRPGAVLLQLEGGYRAFVVRAVRGRLVSGVTFFKLAPGVPVHVRQLEDGREEQWPEPLPPPEIVADPAGLTRPGEWLWSPEERAVYLRSDVPPASAGVRLARVRWGLRLANASHVRVEELTFRGMGEVGVLVQASDHVVLRGLTVQGVGSSGHKTGILLFGSRDSAVEDCRVEDVMGNGVAVYAFGPPGALERRAWNNRIAGNTVLRAGAAGISLATDFPPQAELVQHNRVENNRVEGANRYSYDAAGIYTLFVGGGNVIAGNTVTGGGSSRLRSAGIMLDVGTAPTRVEGNRLEDNSNGGVVLTGPGHVLRGNRMARNCAPSWDCAQLVLFPVRANGGATASENRLEAGPGQKLVLRLATPRFPVAPSSFDRNAYAATDPRPFCWSESWSCTRWLSFTEWQRLGFDQHASFTQR